MGELKLQSNFTNITKVSRSFGDLELSYLYKQVPFMKEFIIRNSSKLEELLIDKKYNDLSPLYPNVFEWSFGYKVSNDKIIRYEMSDKLKDFMKYIDWEEFKNNVLMNMSTSFNDLLYNCDLMYFYTLVGDSITEKNREYRYDQLLTGKSYITDYRTISGTNKLRKLYYVLGTRSEFSLSKFSDNIVLNKEFNFGNFIVYNRKSIHRDFIIDIKKNNLLIPIYHGNNEGMNTIYISGKARDFIKDRFDRII